MLEHGFTWMYHGMLQGICGLFISVMLEPPRGGEYAIKVTGGQVKAGAFTYGAQYDKGLWLGWAYLTQKVPSP